NMRKKHPRLPGHVVRRRVELMRQSVDEVLITFPGDLSFTGTDEHAYHIHAAATACHADLLLTNNQRTDIPSIEDTHYETSAQDNTLVLVTTAAVPKMRNPMIGCQIKSWAKEPQRLQLHEAPAKAGCPDFADIVLRTLQNMS